ncbi:hypothetical protein Cgig2_011787 [Carnegiea gigantea]|uniref:Endonuclease/exonuclease/phosphatase domain-containing protein n=1 Tax=Carnegiea gigantea TaxID=171969 RepID=A0A9Q1JJN6_9CARY|nr:hypothetical protein Cgig2_011787 [Carnegiea gigantea]
MEIKCRGDINWLFSTIYASPQESTRIIFLYELGSFAQLNNRPWLLVGDFNKTCNVEDFKPPGSLMTSLRNASVRIGNTIYLSTLCYDSLLLLYQNGTKMKKELSARIEGIQRTPALSYHRYLIKLEAKLCRKLDEVLHQIDLHTEAIQDGARSTRHYHLSTVIRRRTNHIEALQNTQGTWFWDDDNIKAMMRMWLITSGRSLNAHHQGLGKMFSYAYHQWKD